MEHKLKFKDYNEALKQNKLLGLKCKQCGQISANPRIACAKCGSTDLEIMELKGKGKIQTFTSIFVAPEGRESECPYVVTLVELEEGPWIMGNLVGIDPKEAALDIIGKKVRMSGIGTFAGDKYSAGDIARPLFSLES
jgi:uncharacterized OB-fold protein